MNEIQTIRCTCVLAQVNVGFYDQEGNLVGEETFPQLDGRVAAARDFHPHGAQLASLIDMCVQQGWEKVNGEAREASPPLHRCEPAETGADHGVGEAAGSLTRN